MGLIAVVKSFVRTERNGAKLSDVKLDPGGGANITGEHFADPGDDSHPLPGDYAVTVGIPRNGGQVPVGHADIVNDPESQPGEAGKYGRDPSTGQRVNRIRCKSDGSVIMSNDNGSFEVKADGSIIGIGPGGQFELEAGGDFVVNGARITAAGNVLTALGRSLDLHVHPITGGSSSPGPTGPPV
jgi:hypothetical protein